MQDNEKKPALRFKGFTDPWEQRKFEEIAVRSSVMSDKKGLPRVEYEDIISGAGRLNKDIKLKESEKVGIVFHKGDVLYGKLRPYLQNWLLASFNGLAVGDFWVLQPQNTDSSFLYRLVQSQQFDGVANQSTGTKMPRADWKLVSKTKFAMPHSVDEQAAIGAYFEHLDTLITLHQRKYEKLVNIKKSMLDKMFPQNGASVPEIRFKGFTDPWEQRKVGTLIEDYTEKTVTQNQYPVLTSSQQQGIVLQEDYFADRQVTTDNNVGYYVLPKGYFTYRSRSDTDVFVFNRNNIVDKGIISYYYPVFAPKSCDSNFLLRRLNHGIKKQLSMAAEGTGQKVLAHAKFKNMVVDVPSQSEQEKIGTILEELDTLITLHQRKLEKLQNIKKSCLEKMFV